MCMLVELKEHLSIQSTRIERAAYVGATVTDRSHAEAAGSWFASLFEASFAENRSTRSILAAL